MSIEDIEREELKQRALLYLTRPSNRWFTVLTSICLVGMLCVMSLYTGAYLVRSREAPPAPRQASIACQSGVYALPSSVALVTTAKPFR